MKVALVHDWLLTNGGSEKVFFEICSLFPAPIHTLFFDRKKIAKELFHQKEINHSFLQKIPFVKRKHHWFLPLFPHAIEQFDLSLYDLIISSSHCVAKGVVTHKKQLHICYCHTPMRYVWDLFSFYLQIFGKKAFFRKKMAKMVLSRLRRWDLFSSSRVDHFIANSQFVKGRIEKYYNREAEVIYPPVDTNFFTLNDGEREDFYLTASRLVPYKRVDLLIKAFSHMADKKLIVIGDGIMRKKWQKDAPKNVQFLGFQSDERLKYYLQRAKAFLFAAIEDFGILPVEAQSCGTPVIALGKGGVQETVIFEKTGLFFPKQEVSCVVDAIKTFERKKDFFDPKKIAKHAKTFSKENFSKKFSATVKRLYEDFLQKGKKQWR